MRRARYSVLAIDRDGVLIRDDGPWDVHPTVTNDAEYVIYGLNRDGLLRRRVFYVDSEGSTDELVHADGIFTGFRPAPVLRQDPEGARLLAILTNRHLLERAVVDGEGPPPLGINNAGRS